MVSLRHLRASLLLAVTAACGPPAIDGSGGASGDGDAGSSGDADAGTDAGTDEGSSCPLTCEDPEAVADGYVSCADGAINREVEGVLDPELGLEACHGDEDTLACSSDADCGGGKCQHIQTVCLCVYPCAADSDCGPGQVCVSGGLLDYPHDHAFCAPATCTSNADCGECGECGLGSFNDECEPTLQLGCRTEADNCRTDADCSTPGFACLIDAAGSWTCQEPNSCAVPGRPMLVDDVPRVARARRRPDWNPALRAGATLGQDRELARHWAEVAALEHASVASFARFAQQLLSLGAPPRLVRACQRAALDEIEHARLAYGLANAYGGDEGDDIGPGQLELAGVRVRCDWRELVAALIHEACVGETLNVAEAMAAAEGARAPAVRAVLERVVDDEARHAALAWGSLAWLLERADSGERAWALAVLDGALVRAQGSPGGLHRPADGVLGGATRAQLRVRATAELLAPLAAALRQRPSAPC